MSLKLENNKLEQIEEATLRTLIREFGAKSYEFSLETTTDKILKAHFYFGMRPNFPGPDSFPHVNCFSSWMRDSDLLMFVLAHLDSQPSDENSQSFQFSMF